jgi:hypothetical protein
MSVTDVVLLIAALLGSSTMTAVVNQYFARRVARKAENTAAQAKEDARRAHQAAVDAAQLLTSTGAFTKQQLQHIMEVTEGTRALSEKTHTIVNSQRTLMVKLISTLRRRIASDNPNDELAQLEAQQADSEASEA